MKSVLQDLRYGVRMLWKTPSFTVGALLALALGIGANALIFTLVNAVVLRPLPFPRAEQLMFINHEYRKSNMTRVTISYPALELYRREARSFESLAAFTSHRAPQNLTGSGTAEHVESVLVTTDFFRTLGVQPFKGRGFTVEQEAPGVNRSVVLSYALWQRLFGGREDVLRQTVRLDGEVYEIAGVMPRGFEYPSEVELWTPLALSPEEKQAGVEYLNALGRLRPGVRREHAVAELSAIAAEIRREENIADAEAFNVTTEPMHQVLVGDVRPILLVLMAAVGCVLLIACANVANLLLARAAVRQKEIAIRGAMGASTRRIVRQLLTEGVLLGVLGGAIGLLIGAYGLDAVLAISPVQPPSFLEISIDMPVLLFTFALSVLTGVLFAAFPAWHLTRHSLSSSLREGGTASSVAASGRFRSVLVIGQLALALVLLVGAGLLIRSFLSLQGSDPGFDTREGLIARIGLNEARYPTPESKRAFQEQLLARVSALPGVEHAGLTMTLPFEVQGSSSFTVEGRPEQQPGPHGHFNTASPGLMRALGLRLVRGRWIEPGDGADAQPVIVIEESLAKLYWPGSDPIGQRMVFAGMFGAAPREIVGIVAPVKHAPALAGEKKGMYYFPTAQMPFPWMTLVLKTSSPPESLIAPLRAALADIDPEQALLKVQTVGERLQEYSASARLNMVLLGAFAGLALMLAAVGIYAVISYTVVQRTREIGLRMALGARRTDVFRMLLTQGIRLAALGLSIGTVAALGTSRLLAGMLFGVTPTDPATFVLIACMLAAVAVLASLIPARRATKVDPLIALRSQ